VRLASASVNPGDALLSPRTERLGRRLRAGFVDVGDRHIRAGAKESFRKCTAESTGATGNNPRSPGESEVSHVSAFRSA
jgi:hypothetical protein